MGRGAEGRRLAEKLGAVSDGFDMRLLHYAALGGSLPMCRYLLEDLQLDVNADGSSFGAHLQCLRKLLTSMRRFVLVVLIIHWSGSCFVRLAGFELIISFLPFPRSGLAPIAAAITREDVELVRYFLDQGADTEKLDDKGCTLLHFASVKGIHRTHSYFPSALLLFCTARVRTHISVRHGIIFLLYVVSNI